MISGELKQALTINAVLSKISEYDIFRYYMPIKDWKINRATYSPFRKEDNPSFLIGDRKGTISFIDFADTSLRGDCFTFVKMLYNLPTIYDVLLMIDRDFGLGIHSKHEHVGKWKIITKEYEQPESLGKRHCLIQAITKPFTKEELAYWAQYQQSREDLRKHNVYSIRKLYLDRKLFPLKYTELTFGYYYDGYWKIYRPYGDKKSKWVPNNVPITTMDGKAEVVNCKVAFINKSKKDYMVVKKVFPCACAVQNEGIGCFSPENVDFLKANSERQILSFDSDDTGVKNSQQITQLFGFEYVNVPRMYLSEGIKDWSDLVKAHGYKPLEDYLKQKRLI